MENPHAGRSIGGPRWIAHALAGASIVWAAWILSTTGVAPGPRIPPRPLEDELICRAVRHVGERLELGPVVGLEALATSHGLPHSSSLARLGSFSRRWGLDDTTRFVEAIRTRGRPRVLARHGADVPTVGAAPW